MSEEIKFEKAMDRLAKIVSELESGEVSLDDSLKKYEEGVKLSKICQDQLVQAEKKIEVLTKTLEGSWAKKPFEDSDEALPGEASKIKKSVSKGSKARVKSDEDKDILL